jgi:hypothetical protein
MTRSVLALGAALAALVPLALLPAARAGDKGLDTKGEIKIGNHAVKMESGKLYHVRVEGTGFQPILSITPGFVRTWVPSQFEKNVETRFCFPPETKEYRLYITPATFAPLPEGPLQYKLKVQRIPLSEKPLLQEKNKLTADDPVYENKNLFGKRDTHFKAFKVKMKAGQVYLIDMVRKGKDFATKDIDPYLFLEDSERRIVASDDDSGGNYNARIVFQAPRDGEYRVIATTLGRATGDFTLTVREQARKE